MTEVSHRWRVIRISANENNYRETSVYCFNLERKALYGDTLYDENNYWGTIDEPTIKNKIIDQEDSPSTVTDKGFVKYWPFALIPIDKAGIQ